MPTITEIEDVLQTYELSEIIELNEMTDADILLFLVEQDFVQLPETLPL